ncbi:SirB2 family protein [Moraxella marmotae]|uniref:SirB2 family protein n=1 Tax=Moraxella marmotae TaxID=3344520 RepID=UPI0035F4A7A9
MKHFHMFAAMLVLFVFIFQALPALAGKAASTSKVFKIATHVLYLALVLSGFWLFWQLYQVAGVQHWAIAKMVLLIVAVSATIKAQRNYTQAPSQAKAGLLIATVAYVGILTLAITKPMLG